GLPSGYNHGANATSFQQRLFMVPLEIFQFRAEDRRVLLASAEPQSIPFFTAPFSIRKKLSCAVKSEERQLRFGSCSCWNLDVLLPGANPMWTSYITNLHLQH
ncbi:hypothetical protein KEM54_004386, partial [Ascosphaera aggregata]